VIPSGVKRPGDRADNSPLSVAELKNMRSQSSTSPYRSFATTVSQLQQWHNYNRITTTTVSQLKICDFSGEMFKGFEVP
jgi:hypothetical protein